MAEPTTEPAPLSPAVAAALDDMCRDLDRYRLRQRRRVQLRRGVAGADQLIGELERLVLAGRPVVPVEWQPWLDRLAAALPPGVAADLRCGGPPARLRDEVLTMEERLFELLLDGWPEAAARS